MIVLQVMLLCVMGMNASAEAVEHIQALAPSTSEEVLGAQANDVWEDAQTQEASNDTKQDSTSQEKSAVKKHTVRFLDWDSRVIASVSLQAGQTVSGMKHKPILEGYTFRYWFDITDDEHRPYRFGNGVTRDVTLMAHYTRDHVEEEKWHETYDGCSGIASGWEFMDANAMEFDINESQMVIIESYPLDGAVDATLGCSCEDIWGVDAVWIEHVFEVESDIPVPVEKVWYDDEVWIEHVSETEAGITVPIGEVWIENAVWVEEADWIEYIPEVETERIVLVEEDIIESALDAGGTWIEDTFEIYEKNTVHGDAIIQMAENETKDAQESTEKYTMAITEDEMEIAQKKAEASTVPVEVDEAMRPARQVKVHSNAGVCVHEGENIILTGELIGLDGHNVALQWQVLEGSNWMNIHGAYGMQYSFAATEDSVRRCYRLSIVVIG